MKLTWFDATDPDPALLAGIAAAAEAVRVHETPEEPQRTVRSLLAELRHGWDGEPSDVAAVSDETGRVVGYVRVWLPRRDNTHLAVVVPYVDPAHRRRGIGRRLLDIGIDYAKRHDRTVVISEANDRKGNTAFAIARGFHRAAEEVTRRQDLAAVRWDRLDAAYEDARAHAADYELVRLVGPTPDAMVDDLVVLAAAINDAPTDDLDIEDEVFTAERLRAFETAQAGRDRVAYRVVARHRPSGELAGHTVVSHYRDEPWHADQYDTSVVRAHRGHRLGLLLKIEMLRWLADAEPQLRTILTANAASNDHMIAVNEALGYEVVNRVIEWQLTLADR